MIGKRSIAKKSVTAEVVLAKAIQIDAITDFRHCPSTPLINSNYKQLRKHYFNKLQENPLGNIIVALNYQYDTNDAINSNINEIGGRVQNSYGDAIFTFAKNKALFVSVDSFRDNFFSPVLLLEHAAETEVLIFDNIYSMYCNIMDDETVIYLKTNGL